MSKHLAIILGTRPEIIKCAPVILQAPKQHIDVSIIHTGQHYSRELDGIFFQELNVPEPRAHVHVGSHAASIQIGLMIQRVADVLDTMRPDAVLVQGDTNSVLAGALAATKMGIPIAHLEAGLRSDDWSMPEEANRVLADRISRWLFCPTTLQKERLHQEGITNGIYVVGNTAVDSALHYAKIAYEKSDIAERLGIAEKPFGLLTMHRPSNVDDPQRLQDILRALGQASDRLGLTVIFPIHPRTARAIDRAHLKIPSSFLGTEPLGYLDLLRLQSSAELILTDSGGIQEEACTLRIPCVTLRPNTERPETLEVGSNVLCDSTDADVLCRAIESQIKKERNWANPFGDWKTAEHVVRILAN